MSVRKAGVGLAELNCNYVRFKIWKAKSALFSGN